MCRTVLTPLTYSNVEAFFLERLEVSYDRACMPHPKEEYFTEMLDSLLENNHRHGTPLYSNFFR